MKKHRIGIADTTFARVDMFSFAEKTLKENNKNIEIERYTVPGIKDLPVACKILFEKYNCDIVMALGMPGDKPIDKQCGHEASTAIQSVQLLENKHILEVFVHLDETNDPNEFYEITKNRVIKHAINALKLLESKTALSEMAGSGERQGFPSVGPIKPKSRI